MIYVYINNTITDLQGVFFVFFSQFLILFLFFIDMQYFIFYYSYKVGVDE